MAFPILNKPIGYDLEKADWVPPYGDGIISDFIFEFKSFHDKESKERIKPWEVSFNLRFSNKHDGIQEYKLTDADKKSDYIWPYQAPQKGYESNLYKYISYNMDGRNKITTNIKYNGNQGKTKDDQAYYLFRVRTKVDSSGNIISGNYGKILNDFSLGKKIKFTYYFNPSGTRNLEFAPAKNLFTWPISGTKGRVYYHDRIRGLNP